MKRLPSISSAGRPWSWARRHHAWLAAWLQHRRRARQQSATQPTPNAPTITAGNYQWDATTPGWADVWIDWTFVHGGVPVANIEVWVSVDAGAYVLLATVASTAITHYYANACNGETIFDFKVRYRDGATLGPFSNVQRIEVVIA